MSQRFADSGLNLVTCHRVDYFQVSALLEGDIIGLLTHHLAPDLSVCNVLWYFRWADQNVRGQFITLTSTNDLRKVQHNLLHGSLVSSDIIDQKSPGFWTREKLSGIGQPIGRATPQFRG